MTRARTLAAALVAGIAVVAAGCGGTTSRSRPPRSRPVTSAPRSTCGAATSPRPPAPSRATRRARPPAGCRRGEEHDGDAGRHPEGPRRPRHQSGDQARSALDTLSSGLQGDLDTIQKACRTPPASRVCSEPCPRSAPTRERLVRALRRAGRAWLPPRRGRPASAGVHRCGVVRRAASLRLVGEGTWPAASSSASTDRPDGRHALRFARRRPPCAAPGWTSSARGPSAARRDGVGLMSAFDLMRAELGDSARQVVAGSRGRGRAAFGLDRATCRRGRRGRGARRRGGRSRSSRRRLTRSWRRHGNGPRIRLPRLSQHAPCPVAVVHDAGPTERSRIVLGVDGSPGRGRRWKGRTPKPSCATSACSRRARTTSRGDRRCRHVERRRSRRGPHRARRGGRGRAGGRLRGGARRCRRDGRGGPA